MSEKKLKRTTGGGGIKCTSRILWIDLIRVVSALFIIAIHYCMGISRGHASLMEWFAVGLYSPFYVPGLELFVMVSGFLLLSRATLWDKRFLPRIGRIFVLIAGWSIIFLVLRKVMYGTTLEGNPITFYEAIRCFLTNECHSNLWFLWMLAGLYFVSPILHSIVHSSDKYAARYFVFLSLFTLTLFPWFCNFLCSCFSIDKVYFTFPITGSWCAAFFVAGWYFGCSPDLTLFKEKYCKEKWKINTHTLVYLGWGGLILIALMLAGLSTYLGSDSGFREHWSGKFNAVFAVVLFLLLKYAGSSDLYMNSFLSKIVNKLAPLTLGIYLIHDIVRHILSDGLLFGLRFDIHTLPALISVPLGVLIIFAVSAAITWIMQKVPLVRVLVE